MRKFSEIFSIGHSQAEVDFVDISPDRDTPLFIDPFAISTKDDEWSRMCHEHITHFFQTALDHIRLGREGDARRLLNGLSEPNETCLGLSRGRPSGRGVSGKQAFDLYSSLANSQAARSGILEDLAECDLFVQGIGRDKISDITTNIIRKLLIEYTQAQCKLHGIALTGEYPSGRFWNIPDREWRSEFVQIPVVGGRRVILVPKYSVRRALSLDAQEYYSHHVLNFIQDEEFKRGSSLVRVLKSGERRPPHKKTLKDKFPFSKDFVARFSEQNPDVLRAYKALHKKLEAEAGTLRHRDFDDDFDEAIFATALLEKLNGIPSGTENANNYHAVIVGILEFVFWPNLIYPKKEDPIHGGRKRIDITYTNAAKNGFFYRLHTAHDVASNLIMVECKNYSADPSNPEVDQLSGRFSANRGKLGLLLYRQVDDYARLCDRCRDTAQDGRGIIIPLGDKQISEYLELIANGHRRQIDEKLDAILRRMIN